jgi:hypothetical protein
MREAELHYVDGEEIRVGDQVLFGGHAATVVVVFGRDEYGPDFSRDDWTDYKRGFLLRTADGQLYMEDYADEDIKLLARGTLPARPRTRGG